MMAPIDERGLLEAVLAGAERVALAAKFIPHPALHLPVKLVGKRFMLSIRPLPDEPKPPPG